MFDHGGVLLSSLSGIRPLPPADAVRELQERVDRMQGRPAAQPVATHPALSGLLRLQSGGVYGVDAASLAMMLMAGPSADGAWCAVVGSTDFGSVAAHEMGVELGRTLLVPDPGDSWLEVTAALVDVLGVVVVRPPAAIGQRDAERLAARLRRRGGILVVWGEWPRCDARLSVDEVHWTGAGRGHGHLVSRRATVAVRRGTAPPRRGTLWMPDPDLVVRRAEVSVTPLATRGVG